MLLILTVLIVVPWAEAATYQWVDSQGRPIFSDIPPPSGGFEVVPQPDFPPFDPAAQQRLENLLQSQEKSREARRDKEQERKRLAAEKAVRAENCHRARERFIVLESRPARRIFTTGVDGELRRISEEERQSRLTELRKQIMDNCDD